MKRVLYSLIAAGLIVAAGAHYLVRMQKYKGFDQPVIVDIPRGTPMTSIAETLASQGVVSHPWLFLMARLPNPRALPQAGEYLFDKPATPLEVYLRMARGDVYYLQVTVPEGSNVFDIAGILAQRGIGNPEQFLKAAQGSEGYLFPATYQFKRNATPEDVVSAMRKQFDKVWAEIGGDSPKRETVTLASLVEKETAVPDERSRIAGVYRNRIGKGMRLQCDPTVAYASQLTGNWKGTIYRSDLDRKHAYNTYQAAGLPPGPIANPGRDSLLAALSPAKTDELYFVAVPDGSGAHIFSKDYAAHERAVSKYRRGQQEAKNSRPAPRNGSASR